MRLIDADSFKQLVTAVSIADGFEDVKAEMKGGGIGWQGRK